MNWPFTGYGHLQRNPVASVGRRVYEKSGCPACHTRFVRNTTADIIRYLPDDYLKLDASLAANRQKFQNRILDIYSRRIGPDLEYLTGASTNYFFLENYIRNPQRFYKHSIMPSYDHLFNEKPADDEIFFAYGSVKNKVGFNKYTRGDALIVYLKETSENGF